MSDNRQRHYKVEFGFTPYNLQREIIDTLDGKRKNPQTGEPYRFLIAALGRQSGKSWLARYTLLDRAVNRRQNCMWIAPAIPAARTHWNKLVDLIKRSGIPVKRISQAAKEILFHGGGVISVRSALEPDNLRGDSLDYVVLDEAAFFRDGEYVWWQVVMPMLTATRGVALFTTTPNGRNWLYPLFKLGLDGKDDYYRSWNVPSTASPYQDLKLLERLRTTMPSLKWREEYLAEFLADGGGVFSGLEDAAISKFLGFPEKGHAYIAAIDFGWSNDNNVFTVLDKFTRKQVFGVAFNNIGTIRTVKKLIELMDYWMPEITYIEKNGVGEALLGLIKDLLSGKDIEGKQDIKKLINERTKTDPDGEPLEQIVGNHKIRVIHMTNEIKREMIEKLAADIEYKRLEILSEETPFGVQQLDEMSTFERKRTVTGLATYGAAENHHDDAVMALALAYKGMPPVKKWTMPSPKKKNIGERKTSPFRNRMNRGHKKRIINDA